MPDSCDYPRSNGRGHAAVFLGPGHDQRLFTDYIDQAWHPPRKAVNAPHRPHREQARNPAAGHLQPVPDVFGGIAHIHRCQTTAYSYALVELTQVVTLQDSVELRLAGQNDLYQFVTLCLKVRDQAHLLENVGGQVLGLIDDKDDCSSGFMLLKQKVVERVQVSEAVSLLRIHAELAADVGQELFTRTTGVEDQGAAIFFRVKLGKERPKHGRLAGAHFAGHGNEAGMAVDTVQKVCKGFAMVLAQINELRIGGDRERFFAETEKFTVHQGLLTLSCSLYLMLHRDPRGTADHIAGIDAGLDRNAGKDVTFDLSGEKLPLRQ